PLGEAAALVPELGAPADLGYLDVGRIFSEPHDIVIDLDVLWGLDRDRKHLRPQLQALFGSLWREKMTPCPIVGRMRAARDSLARGEETLERKVRYLFWFN